MYLVSKTGWTLQYIYNLDLQDFNEILDTYLKLSAAKPNDKSTSKGNMLSPMEFITQL